MLDLNPIRERLTGISEAPWQDMGHTIGYRSTIRTGTGKDIVLVKTFAFEGILITWKEGQANMDFICAARDDIPALIAEIEALRKENARLRENAEDMLDDLAVCGRSR